MIRNILFVIVLFVSMSSYANKDDDFVEGEVIFQMSKSSQSPAIAYATMSPWTHCGIIVKKNNNFYVLEASNVVKLTPVWEWIRRGRGDIAIKKRVFKDPVKINYKKYLGKRYDQEFSLKNDKYYCSELVYLIYKEQFGIELAKPKPISKYNTLGLGKLMKKRGIKRTSLFVAPSDLYSSTKFKY